MSVSRLFEKLRAVLDATEIPYFVTGSFASSARGIPRSTNDIDIIIAPTADQLNALIDRLSDPEYYSDRSDRQINDAAGVVRMQSEKLDVPYIESWVDVLGLGEQWRTARERAG